MRGVVLITIIVLVSVFVETLSIQQPYALTSIGNVGQGRGASNGVGGSNTVQTVDPNLFCKNTGVETPICK